ncbi:hypothetical protein MXD62_12995 [Frankia sp. Mgl5]|uniref:Phage FDXHR zinc binding domain-containing protein n=1 Tax=Parafrankia soli TaxID=2599596 RepID=A0A1S1PT22_9ACTN|nr:MULTISPECIES: hypothetical protein [Frankiaceae]ABW11401.1 conserved hypothetical protein [Frankia sp. EAN1pec]CAI7979192.1 conserved hypothetical protein [Frankia sp. Hr75.2]MCK9928080.1 hypothetical protein [Frankia sp. Mgl5]OHV24419.1 hypothetical protein BBK14_06115 [Parafrankia soli]TCJ35946.1 hypothetical protein E0504_25620 [Parafrankia sp. BMG5.11]
MAGRDIDYDRPTLIGCGRCDVRWTALTAAHCPTCHETFVGYAGFDAHRDSGRCLAPGEAGLRSDGGYWRREDERSPGRLVTIPRQVTTDTVARPA